MGQIVSTNFIREVMTSGSVSKNLQREVDTTWNPDFREKKKGNWAK